MSEATLTVSQLLAKAQEILVSAFPGALWVRGEVTGYRRTSGGAAFFRLADTEHDDMALEVGGRGRVMADIERALGETGVGRIRDGVEIRVKGTLGVDRRSSVLRLAILEIDPTFTVGRLAMERAELLKKMSADGSLLTNRSLPIPLVPLRVGLVTSRGSAAHLDFLDQLRRSGYRFRVKTVHATMQGALASNQIARAISRFSPENADAIAVVRGGGSKLDLAVFDSEPVARAVAAAQVPVITGIGHEIDRAVADEAAAICVKTPSAAGEWLVARVKDFADRLERARTHIRREGQGALVRHQHLLRVAAADIAGGVSTLRRQNDHLSRLGEDIAAASRRLISDQRSRLTALTDWFSAVDVDRTLRRGFSIVTSLDGETVIKTVDQISPGDRLTLRLVDGTVRVRVEHD